MKKTKIVCTIGPASEQKPFLERLIKEAGMNVMRMNFSHGDYEEQGFRIKNIRELNKEHGWNVGMILDTKGPEIRTGLLENDTPVQLTKGDKIRITMDYNFIGNKDKIAISYSGLYDDIHIGGRILVEDGLLTLTVLEKDEKTKELICRIENDRKLKNKRNCNVPGVILNMPYISEKDRNDIIFASEQELDFIAASFIRRSQDIHDIREILKSQNNTHTKLISKIENQEGVDNMEEIISLSDGVMVARGDLGVDIDPWDLPEIQKRMIYLAQSQGKFVITATQMLDSMQGNPRPTRAEVSDVHNAVLDGTSCTMLSGESAQGDYPFEAVYYMGKINERAEDSIDHFQMIENVLMNSTDSKEESMIALSVASVTSNFDIKAVVATGDFTFANQLSTYRPASDIFFGVASEKEARSLSILWGIQGLVGDVKKATETAKAKLGLEKGDRIIVCSKDKFEIKTI